MSREPAEWPDLEAPILWSGFSGAMPRKPKHENQPTASNTIAPPVAPTPSILDAFKSPETAAASMRDPTPTPAPEPDPYLSGILDKVAEPDAAPTTPSLPRAVEVLFDLSLEVNEKEKTSISTRLDAATEIVEWLYRVACGTTVYDTSRVGALRVFLEHVVEYKVRCEPKERVRAAGLLLRLG